MEFCKICPRCLKTYVNGSIGKCGYCQVDLINIQFIRTETLEKDALDNPIYKFVYCVKNEVSK
jgi:hypothetical protein